MLARWRSGILLVVLVTMWSGLAAGAPRIKKLGELKPGQTGKGKTVVRGNTIDTFDFEIIDVVQTEGFASNLILVRVGGPLIDKCGGIAAGMSGSPLYIDGALIGALAFTTPQSDTHVGYATAIEDMLRVLDQVPARAAAAPGALAAWPVGTPVTVAGLRGRAFGTLERVFARHGLRTIAQTAPTGGPITPSTAAEFAEGQAVAVGLTSGDIGISALGTISYRDGDRIIAFGHPFMQRGPTALFMQPAFIYTVVSSTNLPFKVGAPAGPPVGAFLSDRAAGIGGLLGRAARSFELQIDAGDTSMGRRRTMTARIVEDVELSPMLVGLSVMQAMSEVMDRAGGGTAEMDWTVEAEGLSQPLHREDLIYNAADLVGEAVPGPLFTVGALMRNDFAAVTPTVVKVKVTTSLERRTVRLVDVEVEPKRVKRGQPVLLTVKLQPYRGAAQSQRLRLVVPETAAAGNLVVEVHGRPESATGPLSQAALMARGLVTPQSLSELAEALTSTQRGNTLVGELLTAEAAAARQQHLERLMALPNLDLFSEEALSMPALGPGLEPTGGRPLAQAQALLDRVVQGRLQATVTVVAQ